jgi:hypothetical protein
MTTLGVEFTDEEMGLLRERAARCGISVEALVHDVVVRTAEDDAVMEATAHVIALSRDLLDRLAQH